MLYLRLLVWVSVVLSLPQGRCVCFFPGELQGVWHTQVTGHIGDGRRVTRSPITYQELTIHSDTILQWGSCHQRLDDYILLTDRSGSTLCYRCIQLEVVTPQVVQVWSTGLQTCYTTEAAALRTCPTPAHLAAHTAAHLMLYKSKTTWGEDAITTVDCPLNGRFTFTYQVGDARRGKTGLENSCDQPTSEFSNCPHGFGFSITYRDCTFPTPRNGSLQCLGSWVGHDRHNYLAVLDSSVKIGSYVPRYKCGMFREEAGTGRVFVAFSEDSTCTNGLYSPTDGYETYVLTSVPPPPLPPDVTSSSCTFPRSLRGHWHHTYVADDTVVFKDYHNYRTYTARCVRDLDDGEHYIVFTRTHCGEWNYNCLWLKRRSANVLEFMLGLYPRETFDTNLCEPDKFGDMTSWTTQGKSLLEEPTTCPIVGNYAGVLPDAPGYCAQLYSDCETPQLMYYTVSDCRNTTYVYEREDLPVVTSETGLQLPLEQKVSTGAVLTIDDDVGRRGRRQVNGARYRVANARTTTISWLWVTPSTRDTSTTTSTTATSTTTTRPSTLDPSWTHLPLPRPPPARVESSNEKNLDRYNPDTFLKSQHQPESHSQDDYSPVGFWSSIHNRPDYPDDTAVPVSSRVTTPVPTVSKPELPKPVFPRPAPARPVPPRQELPESTTPVKPLGPLLPVVAPGPVWQKPDTNADSKGVSGRATWVPGAPPGYKPPFSTQYIHPSEPSPQEPLKDNQYSGGALASNHTTSHNSPAASSTSLQPVEQSSHSQQPLKQGMETSEEREYAWDYRHKYPPGYWLSTGPIDKLATDVSTKSDSLDTREGWESTRDSGHSVADSGDLHGGGGSDGVQSPSFSASLPGRSSGQGINYPFTNNYAPSGLDEPSDVTTSLTSDWKPFGGPSFSSSSTLFSPLDESDSTKGVHLKNEHFDTEDEKLVKDNSSGLYVHNKAINRQPSGRGLWSSATGTVRSYSPTNTKWKTDDKRFSDKFSYTLSTLGPTVFTDSNIDRPGDILNFQRVGSDHHSSVNRGFNGITEDTAWKREGDRISPGLDIHDNLYRDRGLERLPGRDTGARWTSETTASSAARVGGPDKFGYQSNTGEYGRRPDGWPAPAGGTSAHPRRVETLDLPTEREYQCLGQWEEEGRVYALTYRRDIHTYECFVGLIRTGGVVFIKEAGARCSRGIQPEVLGMKLYRKAESCAVEDLTSEVNQSSQRSPERSSATRPPWLRTTKPWKPITARPGHRGSGCKGLFASHHHCIFTLIVALIASTLNII
ncbi:uncharacterized protein [Cherax quadricarinatus]|uniref:uncharacterized protein isoform X1 n=1 Tax=Cherax quadricarinatus TaxID=27406 RepID=UPI00387ED706